jgi:UDP-N-acetyl-2-amino-2-deoxyglucuronate dehydrogenase
MQGGYNFVIIGLGYIAPRHLKAIKDVGGNLLAALNDHDSVGILDSYFPDCHFFTEFEVFDAHIQRLLLDGTKIDYLTVCSPNYLHFSHILYGLKNGFNVICEKPLVINPNNLDYLEKLQFDSKVYTILQLRYHQNLINFNPSDQNNVLLDYVTPRGNWYHQSWKGDKSKSGGLLMNIGVHLFDMLLWKFGDVKDYYVTKLTHTKASGVLNLEKAKVFWSLSVEGEKKRKMTVDGVDVDFNDGFTELHTKCYQEIIAGRGYGIQDVKKTIKLISSLNDISSNSR